MSAYLVILAAVAFFFGSETQGTVLKCSQDFLFSVTQESDGVGLAILYDDDAYSSLSAQNHKQQTISGAELSAECGENLVRCEDPLILTTTINKTAVQHLFFIPLTNGLLIVELVQTGLQVSIRNKQLLNSPQSDTTRCSPVKAFEINHDYYLACVDSQRHYVSMHRIFLNKTVLQKSKLALAPFDYFNIHPSLDMQTLSNFVYFGEDIFARMVAFAVDNFMYAIDILAYSGVEYYGSIGNNCTHVKYLEYIGDHRLLAYCDFVNVKFNTQFEDWEFQWWNNLDGVPYSCPNRSYELRVFNNPTYLRYTINTFVGNVDLLGNGVHDGVCFGAANKDTLFVYSDQNSGVYAVNMQTFKATKLMSASCEIAGCLSIDVVNDRYLVIRRNDRSDESLTVLDVENNEAIMTSEHYTPAFFKFVSNVSYPSDCGQTNRSITIDFQSDAAVNTGAIAAGSVVVAVLVFVVAMVTIIVVHITIQRNKIASEGPIQDTETEEGSDRSAKVLSISTNLPSQNIASHFTRTTHPHQPFFLGVPNISKGAPPAGQTTPPIEECDKFGKTQQVGNNDESPFTSSSSSTDSTKENAVGQIDSTHETLVTQTKGATGTDLPQADYLRLSGIPYQPSNILDETPKLNTVDRRREKWAEADNQSESSHSSIYMYDNDKRPLLKD